MWKNIKDTLYYLLFKQTSDSDYELYITDYISIWNTIFTTKTFLTQILQSNEGLELDNDNEFIQKGIHLLSHPDKFKKQTVFKEDNGTQLSIVFSIPIGYSFYFECKLFKGSDELFFQKVTQPLLKTVNDLRNSQDELRHLLVKKDKEIDEYKCEGGEIVLRHLKTVAFNDDEHMKKHQTYEQNFGSTAISPMLLEQTFSIKKKTQTQTTIVKEEYPLCLPKVEETVSSSSKEDVTTLPINCKVEVKVERKDNKRKRLRKLNF